ncbi:MAG: hypothetical protein U9O20_01840 [Patescibacteria group bacterium]|nr:hypothetical protein [Patescibacteria group bacterium]
MNTKQKDIIDMINNDSNMSAKLKESFIKQVSQMNEDELEAFLKSMKKAKDNKNLQEKILRLQETEKNSHTDFLQTAYALLKKITTHKRKKQEESDKIKTNEILNKIKSS